MLIIWFLYGSPVTIFIAVFTRSSAQCGYRLGKFSVEGMLAIIRFTALLNDCRSECISLYCTFALSLFSLPRRSPHVKRLLIGQKYDHATKMNSESTKELLIWRNSVLVRKLTLFLTLCISGRRSQYRTYLGGVGEAGVWSKESYSISYTLYLR